MSSHALRCCRVVVAFLAMAWGFAAQGAELDEALTQYGHTAWRLQDGAFSGTPTALAQTSDGYLWVGTKSGLLRFDGVRFVVSPGKPLSVVSLLAASDGTLWVGTGDGLFSIAGGQLQRHANANGYINAIVQTKAGGIWFTRSRIAKDGAPLCTIVKDDAKCFGKQSGIEANHAGDLAVDGTDALWLEEAGSVRRWSPGHTEAFQPASMRSIDAAGVLSSILPREDGSVLVGASLKGYGLGLLSLHEGRWSQAVIPGIDSSQLEVSALMAERDQSIWIGTQGNGIVRVHHQSADRFGEADGLTGNVITSILADIEGNVWVTTTKGLDCFRRLSMVSYSQRQGLPSDLVGAVAASRNGAVWVGSKGGLALLQRGVITARHRDDGFPGVRTTTLWERATGQLWLAIDGEMFTFANGTFQKLALDGAASKETILAIVEDSEHAVWIMRAGRPYRLYRYDVSTRKFVESPLPPTQSMRSLAADPAGGLLVGSDKGVLSLRNNAWSLLVSSDFDSRQIATYPDGSFWSATQHGLAGWKNHHAQMLDMKAGLPCENIYSAILDDQENLWAYASCGLIKVSKGEVATRLEGGSGKVAVRLFDVFDGVFSAMTPFGPAVTKSTDGRLWFANGNILQTIDPAAVIPATPRMQVRIEEFDADHAPIAFETPPRLAALTRAIEVRYTALSPANAKRLRFRYRLDGVDLDWQDAGTRRQAFYNDLPPGRYRFRVVALNGDGVWSVDGAALDFSVAPAWYQTTLFRVVSALAVLLAFWVLYSARIGQVRREAAARFDERMEDRTRLARDLHDTLLQTIQASKMLADVALEEPGKAGAERRAVERISVWLAQALDEGRAALQSLRLAGDESSDLAVALEREVARCNEAASMRAMLVTEGDAWEMHPIVQDEIFRIGAEAINNARAHSNGHNLFVTLAYSKDFMMRVADDGDGLDTTVLAQGRAGHFGIAGMQERAVRIGASLRIEVAAEGGSVVTLRLPRTRSSLGTRSWLSRLRTRLRRR